MTFLETLIRTSFWDKACSASQQPYVALRFALQYCLVWILDNDDVLLSVECYVRTDYKFTCVCLCVCVTLSVNSPTGQTPRRIFTVDSLKTRIYARMCLLGVSMIWGPLKYGVHNPWNSHFGGLDRHFQSNMRKIQIAISSDLCIRLTWNLTGSCGQQQRLRGWSRMVVKQFQDGGRPPFWKSIYRHMSVKNHWIFMKFCIQQ